MAQFKTPSAAKYTRLAGLLSPVAMLFRNVKSGQNSSVACLRPRIFEMSTTEAPDRGEDVVCTGVATCRPCRAGPTTFSRKSNN